MNVQELIQRLNTISDTVLRYGPPDARVLALRVADPGQPFAVTLDMAGSVEIGDRLRDLLAAALAEDGIEFRLESMPGRRYNDNERTYEFHTEKFSIKLAGMPSQAMLDIYDNVPADNSEDVPAADPDEVNDGGQEDGSGT